MPGLLGLLSNRPVMGDSTLTLGEAFGIYDRGAWTEFFDISRGARGDAGNEGNSRLLPCCLRGGAGAHLATHDKTLAGTARARKNPVFLVIPDKHVPPQRSARIGAPKAETIRRNRANRRL